MRSAAQCKVPRGFVRRLDEASCKFYGKSARRRGYQALNPNALDPGFGAVQQVKDDYLNLMKPQMDQNGKPWSPRSSSAAFQ